MPWELYEASVDFGIQNHGFRLSSPIGSKSPGDDVESDQELEGGRGR